MPLIKYIGWLGHQNIGDEGLYMAFKRNIFPECLLMPFYDFSLTSLLSIFKRKKYVVLGGGTLINDDSYLDPLEMAQRLGYSTFIFGTGVGDLDYWSKFKNSNRGNSKRWIKALAKADYIGVRGPRSLQWLQDNGITSAEIVGDPALSLKSISAHKFQGEIKTIGLNLGSHDPVSGDVDNLNEVVLNFIKIIIKQNYTVKYISMHPIDFEIGKKFSEKIKDEKFIIMPLTSDVDTVLQQLQSTQIVIGQRLHATVFACALGIPNISLSYQPKCLDFLESIEQGTLAISTNGIKINQLTSKFTELINNYNSIKMEINLKCDTLRKKQKDAANNIIQKLNLK